MFSFNDTKVILKKLHWSKLGGGTTNWPSHWDGSTTMQNTDGDNIIIGNFVNELSVPTIEPGEHAILAFDWQVPNPEDFEGIFSSSNNEFSFLARIISNTDPMFIDELYYDTNNDGTVDTGNIWINTKSNNNIAWKNVTVIEPTLINSMTSSFTISNFNDTTQEYSLEFSIDDNLKGTAIFEEAAVSIQLDNALYNQWQNSGAISANIENTANQQLTILEEDASLENISLVAGEIQTIPISFNFLENEISTKKEFVYHFTQRDKATGDIISGKTFIIKKGNGNILNINAGNDFNININQTITLNALDINVPATYNWYDPDGNLIYTGLDFTLSPELTKKYTLEVILEEDGATAYDEVQVSVNPYFINIISPNPATNQVSINYEAHLASSAYFIFTNINSNTTYNHIINTSDASVILDISTYPTGIYVVSLVCNGIVQETKQLIIN